MRTLKRLARIAAEGLKLLPTSACLVLCLSNLTSARDVSVVSGFDPRISVIFEVQRVSLDKCEEIIVRYQVKNKGGRDIYLVVTSEPTYGEDQSKRELFIYLEKHVLNYHYFELPKL